MTSNLHQMMVTYWLVVRFLQKPCDANFWLIKFIRVTIPFFFLVYTHLMAIKSGAIFLYSISSLLSHVFSFLLIISKALCYSWNKSVEILIFVVQNLFSFFFFLLISLFFSSFFFLLISLSFFSINNHSAWFLFFKFYILSARIKNI